MNPTTAAVEKYLRARIEGEVRFDAGTLAVYATDASNYRQVPIGVVIPRHEGDVSAAIAVARENQMPILARGGGTALGGQGCNAAIVLDFSKYMNRVLSIDAGRRIAEVEPGCVQSALDAALAPHGLFFAPDPSTKDRCTLGGMIGNNSCGAHSAAYGKTVDNLAALDVILYDGTRMHFSGEMTDTDLAAATALSTREGELYAKLRELRDHTADSVRANFPRLPRRVSGYNLDQLLPEANFNVARAIVGSEGTLAVTTRAWVSAAPRPKKTAMVVLGFDDVFRAADQMPWMLEHRPEALEGFDHQLPDFARIKRMPAVNLLPAGNAFLIAELGGASGDEANDRAAKMIEHSERTSECTGTRLLTDPREQAGVWRIRESGLGSGAYFKGRPRTWPGAEDCAVPPARLGEYLRGFDSILAHHGLTISTYYGHFGEGCVHARISFDLASEHGIATFRAAMEEIGALVAALGGSVSGEHGDGIARSELLPKMFTPDLIDAFRSFKLAFDPDRMMNPGVIVDPHPLDSHLKLGAKFWPRTVTGHFDLAEEGGIAGAALKCVGIGKCRKTETATMCPSYMATRDEKHSTRGRARLLLEALSTDLLPAGFGDEALKESLDLCLSCKACKSECPSSIDMAAYRAEFFANYYRTHPRGLASWFFGHLHEAARLADHASALANSIAKAPVLGTVGKRMLGIHRARQIPRFARQSFMAWFASRRSDRRSSSREVMLFPDTFNNFFEPEVAVAAVEVLERAGFGVTIPPRDVCCGRPLYDQGMLDRARSRLREIIDVLGPAAARGTPIIGLEPSCLLTFRDEMPSLFPEDAAAKSIAANSLMLDEFLAREGVDVAHGGIKGHALLHGHCHQKAIAGIENEIAIISQLADLKCEVLDAGCCGMAGAFGYDREHYEVSRTLARRVLIPAIEKSSPDTIVIADGFSCRSQVRHFFPTRRVIHLAEALNASAATASS